MTNVTRLNRRLFISGSGALLVGTALTPAALAQGGAFIVGNYGGSYGERFERLLDRPIAEKHGLQLQLDQGDGAARKTKLLVERVLPRASMDIAHVIDSDAFQLNQEGVLEQLDAARFPNSANLLPSLATPYYVPWAVAVLVIAYDPAKISTPPTSYADLWKPEYAGMVGLADILSVSYPWVATLAAGKALTQTEGSNDKLLELKQGVQPRIYPTHEALAAAFKNGEIAITFQYIARINQWKQDGISVEAAWPSEGAVATTFGVSIPARAGNKDAAYDYLDTLLSPEVMAALCRESFYAPATSNAAMTPEEIAVLAVPESEAGKLQPIDPAHQAANVASWQEFWNTGFKA